MLIEDLWNGRMDDKLKEKADSFRDHLIGDEKENKVDEAEIKRSGAIDD